MSIDTSVEITLHGGQYMAMTSKARFISLIAGTGGGKTFLGPIWMYAEIARFPNDQWMVVAPTYKLLMRATLPMFLDVFGDVEKRFKKGDMRYELPCGGTVFFCSADRPNALEGGQFRGAWLDEAGQMVRWVFVVIQARLGFKKGRCLITTTPYGLNWLYTDVLQIARISNLEKNEDGTFSCTEVEGSDPDHHVIQFSSDTNPYYPADEIARMKRTLTEKEFAMRYLGRFEALSGLVYPDLLGCVVEEDDYRATATDMWVGGLDPGYSDPFAAITAVYGTDGRIHLRRSVYQTRKLLRDIAGLLDMKTLYYCDPAAKREAEEIQALGVQLIPGINDVRPGILKVSEYIKDRRLVIPKVEFADMISEAATYVFDEKKDEPNRKSPHHLLDALRYMVMGVEEGARMEIYFV